MGRRSRRERHAAAPPEDRLDAATRPTAPHAGSPAPALVAALFLIAGNIVIFAQLHAHDFLNYDDPIYITQNEHVRTGLSWASVSWAFRSLDFNWHPLTWISHMLDVNMFGIDAGAHLLVNAAIHSLNSLLVFILFRRMTRTTWRSFIVAAIFAFHPLHVESVAWLAERKDVLSTLFLLLALAAYLLWTEGRKPRFYALLLIAFLLGMMCKGMLVTLPLLLLLLDYWPLQRLDWGDWNRLRKLSLEKLPLFLLDIPGAIITLKAQAAVKAIGSMTVMPLPIRLANAGISYVRYIRKAIWPSGLALPYPYPPTIAPSRAVGALFILILITVAAFRFRERRYLLTGWLWFLVALLPVIGLVQIGAQSMADRYTYVALIGLSFAVVWLAADAVAMHREWRVPATVMTAIILVAFMLASRVQAGYWRDSETLFTHALAVTKYNPTAHMNLGDALLHRGQAAEAVEEYRQALSEAPSLPMARTGLAQSLFALGETTSAERELQSVLARDPANPEALHVLARLRLNIGDTKTAAELYEKILKRGPDPESSAGLAFARGDYEEAIRQYRQAVKLDPKSPDLHNNLAAALARTGRENEAAAEYAEALQDGSGNYDAFMNLGALYSRLNRNDEAVERFRSAAALRPRSPEPHVYLALLYGNGGRIAEAIEQATSATQLDATASNRFFTNAVRIPFKPTNFEEYIDALKERRGH